MFKKCGGSIKLRDNKGFFLILIREATALRRMSYLLPRDGRFVFRVCRSWLWREGQRPHVVLLNLFCVLLLLYQFLHLLGETKFQGLAGPARCLCSLLKVTLTPVSGRSAGSRGKGTAAGGALKRLSGFLPTQPSEGAALHSAQCFLNMAKSHPASSLLHLPNLFSFLLPTLNCTLFLCLECNCS